MKIQIAVCFLVLAITSGVCPGQQAETPARVSSGVMAGMAIKKVLPAFPPEAKAQRVNGAVVMHVIIGVDGHVETATVVSGPEVLQALYLAAVRQWTYRPYLLNGKAVRVDTTVTLSMAMGASDETHQPLPAGARGNGDSPVTPLQVQNRVRVSSGVMMGQLLKRVDPVYSQIAKDEHVSGALVLHVIVGKDGHVLEANVISGPEILRARGLAAIKQWEFRPYMLEGVPTEVETTIALNYDFGG